MRKSRSVLGRLWLTRLTRGLSFGFSSLVSPPSLIALECVYAQISILKIPKNNLNNRLCSSSTTASITSLPELFFSLPENVLGFESRSNKFFVEFLYLAFASSNKDFVYLSELVVCSFPSGSVGDWFVGLEQFAPRRIDTPTPPRAILYAGAGPTHPSLLSAFQLYFLSVNDTLSSPQILGKICTTGPTCQVELTYTKLVNGRVPSPYQVYLVSDNWVPQELEALGNAVPLPRNLTWKIPDRAGKTSSTVYPRRSPSNSR